MIKNYFKVRAINKRLQGVRSKKPLEAFQGQIKNALVLVVGEALDYGDAFKDLHLGLGIASKDVHLLYFKDNIPKKLERPLHIITPSQFNIKGAIKGDFAPFKKEFQYDLVIAYYDQPQLFLNNLVIEQQKAFKVGLGENHAELFHFILAIKTSQFDLFIAELLRYLRILKYIP